MVADILSLRIAKVSIFMPYHAETRSAADASREHGA
jgi:hypothetical protein